MTEDEKLKIAEIVGELIDAIIATNSASTALALALAAKTSGKRVNLEEIFLRVDENNEKLKNSLTSALKKVEELP